jgi:ectoine hydroxylase-related dioxygenase (phytanoyl-CoA dioxygenase family)
MASPTFDEAGYAILDAVVALDELATCVAEAERLFSGAARRAGVRGVLPQSIPIAAFVRSGLVKELVHPILGREPFVVRSILFDKTPDANWDVAWHQDATIAVARRIETPGFGPWSLKAGVVHVRPPAGVLEQMLTVRLHLDACGEDNGPLLVAPGSHRNGIELGQPDVEQFERMSVACTVNAGGVVLMRPLLFHASRKALQPAHRRVLHLEFAHCSLPAPLQWAAA